MHDVLTAFLSAQRGRFTRYRTGGCGGCGYQRTDTLEQVAQKHDRRDVDKCFPYIQRDQSDPIDRNMRVQPIEVVAVLRNGPFLRLIALRTPEERALLRIPCATLSTEGLGHELIFQPNASPIISTVMSALAALRRLPIKPGAASITYAA